MATLPIGITVWIMQRRQSSRWTFIAPPIPKAHLRCAVPNCSFAAICGSRYWGQVSKKASWESGLMSRQRSEPLTRNTWPVYLTKRSAPRLNRAMLHSRFAAAVQLPKRLARTELRDTPFYSRNFGPSSLLKNVMEAKDFSTTVPES